MAPVKKISTKLFLTYIVACLLPILITAVFLVNMLASFTAENTRLLSSSRNEQLQAGLIRAAADAESIIGMLASDEDLTRYLSTRFDSDYEAFQGYSLTLERRIRSLVSRQYTVLLYTENPSLGISRMTNNSLADFESTYRRSATLSSSGISYARIAASPSSPGALGFFRVHKTQNTPSDTIVYSVEIPIAYLLPSYGQDGAFPETLFLFDGSGNVLASTGRSDSPCEVTELGMQGVTQLSDLVGRDFITMEGTRYVAFFDGLQKKFSSVSQNAPDWYLLYLIPNHNLQQNVAQIILTCTLMIISCVILSFVLATAMSRSITTRLSSLGRKTKEVLGGNFQIASDIRVQDEIGALEANVYEMVGYISNMVGDIYSANTRLMQQQVNFQKLQREKTKTELIALRRQINPHYLFNTLESIRMHLIVKGDKETSEVIKKFSSSFRATLETRHETYTLADELRFVEDYIDVQKYRTENKFTYSAQVPPELTDCVVPKLLLQLIVENAVYHGVEGKLGTSAITVRADASDSLLTLTVTDNGAGMKAQRLEDLHRALSDPDYLPDEFLALRNIRSQLSLLSGNRSLLTVDSAAGEGTTVTISFPLIYGKGGPHADGSAGG